MNLDTEPSRSKLVRAYRRGNDLTLMEVRWTDEDYGVASGRLGILAICEDSKGEITARLDSVELTGLHYA